MPGGCWGDAGGMPGGCRGDAGGDAGVPRVPAGQSAVGKDALPAAPASSAAGLGGCKPQRKLNLITRRGGGFWGVLLSFCNSLQEEKPHRALQFVTCGCVQQPQPQARDGPEQQDSAHWGAELSPKTPMSRGQGAGERRSPAGWSQEVRGAADPPPAPALISHPSSHLSLGQSWNVPPSSSSSPSSSSAESKASAGGWHRALPWELQ